MTSDMINPVLARVLRKSTIPMAYEVFATHRWHQPCWQKVWQEAVELYEKKVKQTEAATRARTKNVT